MCIIALCIQQHPLLMRIENLFWLLVFLFQFIHSANSQIRSKDWCFCWELASAPAIGFFPFGGAKLENVSMSSFIAGSSIDLYTIDFLNLGEKPYQERFSPFNLSAYLFGFNLGPNTRNNLASNASNSPPPQDSGTLLQQAYIRFGPKYRFQGFGKNGSFALSANLGYGILLQGAQENAHSKWQHGLDISFSFIWTPFRKNR